MASQAFAQRGGWSQQDYVGTKELKDGSNIPTAGKCLVVDTDTSLIDYATCGAGGGLFTDGGTNAYLTTTTDDLIIGGTTQLSSSKFSIDGDSDQIQVTIQGNSTQTADLFVVEDSAGVNFLDIDGLGVATFASTVNANSDLVVGGNLTVTGNTTWSGVSTYPLGSTADFNGTLDAGDSAFTMANSSTPSLSSQGQMEIDTAITSHDGLLTYYTTAAGTMVIPAFPLADLTTTDNDVVAYSSAKVGFNMEAGSGGGGTPGGSDTQVQFNDSSSFGGDAGLIYNKTTNKLTVAGTLELTSGDISTTSNTISFSTAGSINALDFGDTTADPCGSLTEGSIFWNSTSNYFCACDGTNDVKMNDNTTACF